MNYNFFTVAVNLPNLQVVWELLLKVELYKYIYWYFWKWKK